MSPGQLTSEDTAGHCCWPEQAWSKLKGRCVGEPACMSGFVKSGETCQVEAAPKAVAEASPATPAHAEAAPKGASAKHAQELREQGLQLYKSNDFEGAQGKLAQSLKLNDQDFLAHKLYAASLAATGDINQALVHYKRYLALAPPTDPNYGSVRDTVAKFEASRR